MSDSVDCTSLLYRLKQRFLVVSSQSGDLRDSLRSRPERRSAMANSELEFVGLSGETITKEPGSINGHVSSSPIWNRTLKDWDIEVLSGRHRDSIPAHMKLGDQVVVRRNAPGL